MREYVIKRTQQRRYNERYSYDQSGISDCLLSRRPCDMAHFNTRFLEIFCEFHMFLVIKNPVGG